MPSTYSVAQGMSWAGQRTTKRLEDRAYSLMGLFGVYMPMIYGERERAFVRLQQHIIQKCKDESIFAWRMEPSSDATKYYSGLYAPSPSAFTHCSNMVPAPGSRGFSEANDELPMWLRLLRHTPGTSLALLNCIDKNFPDKKVAIVIAETTNRNGYVRIRDLRGLSSDLISTSRQKQASEERQIRFPVDPTELPLQPMLYGFWLRTLQPQGWNDG